MWSASTASKWISSLLIVSICMMMHQPIEQVWASITNSILHSEETIWISYSVIGAQSATISDSTNDRIHMIQAVSESVTVNIDTGFEKNRYVDSNGIVSIRDYTTVDVEEERQYRLTGSPQTITLSGKTAATINVSYEIRGHKQGGAPSTLKLHISLWPVKSGETIQPPQEQPLDPPPPTHTDPEPDPTPPAEPPTETEPPPLEEPPPHTPADEPGKQPDGPPAYNLPHNIHTPSDTVEDAMEWERKHLESLEEKAIREKRSLQRMELETDTHIFKSSYFDGQRFEIRTNKDGVYEPLEWYSTNPELARIEWSDSDRAVVYIKHNSHGAFTIFARSENTPEEIYQFENFVVKKPWRLPGFGSDHVPTPLTSERDQKAFQQWFESPEYAERRTKVDESFLIGYHTSKFIIDVIKAIAPKGAGGVYDAYAAYQENPPKWRNVAKELTLAWLPGGSLIDVLLKARYGDDYMYYERTPLDRQYLPGFHHEA